MKMAVLCYVEHDDSVLMLHRNKRKNDYHLGKWNGLGGKFLPGESPEQCLLREVREESGLEPVTYSLRGIITFPLFDGVEDWYTFVYTASTAKKEVIDPEEGTLAWIPRSEVPDLNLWEGDRIFLDWVFNRTEFFSAVFRYQAGEFKDYEVVFYPASASSAVNA
ncbi:NUDIX hydrolase [Acidaminobacter sp.]|uniref:NUDIX hydrolase n=1 Tax=Acidaminobacter sp. TaxID=1872102 RepID=UPI001381EE6C|nr:8-oxo-dGTP diphosphatase [Acidaminobacter sp.]MDK9709940.1 8-oxo-dGTP diphosphatase [Acidaminobacter sp.]MZQ97271.1 NUDIX domain-containing protein [Acidaminobacter sp.]